MRFLVRTIATRTSPVTEAGVRDSIESDLNFESVVEASAVSTMFEADDEADHEDLGIPGGLADGFTARYRTNEGATFVLIYWDEGFEAPVDGMGEWYESPVTILIEEVDEARFVAASAAAASVTSPLGLRVNAANLDSWFETKSDEDDEDWPDYVPVRITDPLVRAEWREARESSLDIAALDADVGGFAAARVRGVTQEALPLPSKVSALDVAPDGTWVGISAKNGDLLVDGKRVLILAGSADWHVRVIDDERIFVFHYRYGENALVVSRAGDIAARWSIPPGISDVVVTDDFIVVGFSDEGVFSHGGELGENGLVAFTFDGEVALRYQRDIRESVDIAHLYAMAPLGGNRVAFSAYTKFEYVELDIGTREHVVRRTPSAVHYSRAITSDGTSAWFLSRKNTIRRLDIETGRVDECGRFPDGTLVRGIADGRFLSSGTNGYTIVDPAAVMPKST